MIDYKKKYLKYKKKYLEYKKKKLLGGSNISKGTNYDNNKKKKISQ